MTVMDEINNTLESIGKDVAALNERPDREINVDARSTIHVQPTPINVNVEAAKSADVTVNTPSAPKEWLVTLTRDKDKFISTLHLKALS